MKTFKTLILTIIIIGMANGAHAQPSRTDSKGAINGMLVDKEDGIPVGFSNVVLYSLQDSVMVTWTITDDKGNFQLTKVPEGNYNLVINFIGYEKLKIKYISISSNRPVVELGKIELNKDAIALADVSVVGVKNTYEVKSDKKVINVSKDINSTGGTAVDVLRNVPGLTVDADGAVSLRGSDNLSILVDGRPTSIDARRLDQLSSADIESIELITTPSVKYNPEGKSGIINLKLKHKKEAGLSGNAMINAGTGNKYTGAASLNYNIGKFNIFAGYDGISKVVNSSRYLFRESYYSDSEHYLQQDAVTKLNIASNKYKLGVNIYLNPKNSLTLSMSANPSVKTDADETTSQYFDREMNLSNTVLTLNAESSDETSHDYIAGYRRAFDKKGEELTVDYIFTNTAGNQLQPLTYFYTDSTVNHQIITGSKTYNSNLQLNWVLPVSSITKIENGFQGIMRGTESTFQENNYSDESWIEDLSKKDIFSYYEQIYSVYSLLTSKYDKLSLSAGLRMEQTFVKGTQEVTADNIKQNYFNLYPSFSLLDQITDNGKLQLSYSRRINRPNARMINPFADQSNPEVVRSGNPELKPEYVNSLETGYTNSWGSGSVGLTAYYRHTTDAFNQLTTLDSTGISHIFPVNMSSAENYGVESTFEHEFAKWVRINGNASFYRNIIKGGGEENNSNSVYSYTFRINANFLPMKKTSVQLTGNYTGPTIGLYSKANPQYYVDLAIKKDFLMDKLSMTLRASDIFNTLKNSYNSWGDNFASKNWRKQETRVLYLSLTYTFGSGKADKSSKSEKRETSPVMEIF
jgi:outer membrane receptor protein involved in Fe transport